jgi:hypothetical protein
MIQRIVLIKWKPGTTAAQIDEAVTKAQALVTGVDGVEQITFGTNVSDRTHGFTHAIVIRLSDEEALSTYAEHPLRERYVSDVLAPIEDERIELDVPDKAPGDHRRKVGVHWEWGVTRPSASAAAAALKWEESHYDED